MLAGIPECGTKFATLSPIHARIGLVRARGAAVWSLIWSRGRGGRGARVAERDTSADRIVRPPLPGAQAGGTLGRAEQSRARGDDGDRIRAHPTGPAHRHGAALTSDAPTIAPMTDDAGAAFDLAVIGGGPAGVTAALRAAELGARVALIERDSPVGRAPMMAARPPASWPRRRVSCVTPSSSRRTACHRRDR
jgi:NADPH-dependent 2,4-dienoyl-CoA reductase/sulfur reductase-like enzyme